MAWIGLDIGGANLKAAFPDSPDCPAMEMPFPMWTDWQLLEEAIGKLIGRADADDSIAVTMTGELADNFENRRAGVFYIADAVERVCQNRRVVYYSCDEIWRSREKLEEDWDLVAAANWHATATWGARLLPDRNGAVIDVGSTTTCCTSEQVARRFVVCWVTSSIISNVSRWPTNCLRRWGMRWSGRAAPQSIRSCCKRQTVGLQLALPADKGLRECFAEILMMWNPD